MYHPKDVFENPENYIDFLTSKDFEGQFFERKEIVKPYNKNKVDDVKKGVKETISAFANYNQVGGLLVLGINDETNEITGLDHLNEEQLNSFFSVLQNEIRNHATICKTLRIKNTDNQELTIYLLYVPYTPDALCETVEAVPKSWKRVAKQSLPLSDTDKKQILRDKRVLDWESIILDAEFDEEMLDPVVAVDFKNSYLKESGYELSIKDILINLGAIRKQKGVWYWTNAGILLFDRSPQRMIPQAAVRFLRYDYLIDEKPHLSQTNFDKTFSHASLPTLMGSIRKFCEDSAFFRFFTIRNADGHLQDFPQFPPEAVEEAIINALIHRDYALTTPCLLQTLSGRF